MQKFKSILIGLILLIATSLIALLSWMWQRNSHNINPLPIPANDIELSLPIEGGGAEGNTTDDFGAADNGTDNKGTDNNAAGQSGHPLVTEQLQACADEQIQPALTEVMIKFERRYPTIDIKITYVDSATFLQDCPIDQQDMLLLARPLSPSTLTALETPNHTPGTQLTNGAERATSKDHNSDLTPFAYTLKQDKRFEGVILSDSTPAVNLRNYLLSSVGQETFVQFGYDSIDGYSNQVDDLFNPKLKSLSQKDDTILPVVGE